ncbi:MAG: hypothetical protein U1F43_25200 [Myxococcota bacterium]
MERGGQRAQRQPLGVRQALDLEARLGHAGLRQAHVGDRSGRGLGQELGHAQVRLGVGEPGLGRVLAEARALHLPVERHRVGRGLLPRHLDQRALGRLRLAPGGLGGVPAREPVRQRQRHLHADRQLILERAGDLDWDGQAVDAGRVRRRQARVTCTCHDARPELAVDAARARRGGGGVGQRCAPVGAGRGRARGDGDEVERGRREGRIGAAGRQVVGVRGRRGGERRQHQVRPHDKSP